MEITEILDYLLERLDRLRDEGVVEKAEEERLRRQIEEEVKKKILSSRGLLKRKGED